MTILPPSSPSTTIDTVIKKIIRQAARWSTAAEQDANPLIRVLHANYGAGYLWALGDAGVTPDQINQAMGSGFNYNEFRDYIVNVQDSASRAAITTCPDFGPPETVLTKIGGEGN